MFLQEASSFSVPSASEDQTTLPIRSFPMTPEAERFNGWAAMLGFVAAVGAYVTTGQIIPGIF